MSTVHKSSKLLLIDDLILKLWIVSKIYSIKGVIKILSIFI